MARPLLLAALATVAVLAQLSSAENCPYGNGVSTSVSRSSDGWL